MSLLHVLYQMYSHFVQTQLTWFHELPSIKTATKRTSGLLSAKLRCVRYISKNSFLGKSAVYFYKQQKKFSLVLKGKRVSHKKKSLKNRISTPDVWKKKANTKFQLFKKKLLPIDKSGYLQIFMASVVKMSIPNNYREE